MKISLTKNTVYTTAVLLFAYYLFVAYQIFKNGTFSNEGLFYAEKAALLANKDLDKLKLVGLVFPQIPFICTWLFSIFNQVFAPFAASAAGTAILFYVVVSSIGNHPSRNWLFLGILLTFVFHPGFLFVAVSGKSIYMMLIFFYLFISSFFRYFKSNTSYHISLASIYFTLLIFCKFKFIWLVLFILPVIFVSALQSMQIGQYFFLDRIAFALNSVSIRRKLVNKTIAVYLVIFALPLTTLFIYKILNQMYTGDGNYFLDSPYANFSAIVNQTENFEGFLKNRLNVFLPEVNFLTSVRVMVYAPLLLFCLAIFKSTLRNMFIVLSLFFFVEFLKIKYAGVYIPIEYYIAFICLSWAIILNSSQTRTIRYTEQFYIAIICVQMSTGYLMMAGSHIPEERKYAASMKNFMLQNKTEHQNGETRIANYVKKLPHNVSILADDATAYRIIALSAPAKRFLVPAQNRFLSAFEQPETYVQYILINKRESVLSNFSLLSQNMLLKLDQKQVDYKTCIEDQNWMLLQLVRK